MVWGFEAVNGLEHPGIASSEGIIAIYTMKYLGDTCDVGVRCPSYRKLPNGLGI